MKRIVVWYAGGAQALCDALNPLEALEIVCARDRSHALGAMDDADALITNTIYWDAEFAERLRRSRRLEWVQILNAGFDNMERLGVPERVTVSTLGDIGSTLVAEHALALLLALLRGLPAALEGQRAGAWNAGPVIHAARTLHGLAAAVVGFGHIGRQVAALGLAFGARIVAFARTARTGPGGIEVRALATFRASLPELDAVVICAPLNEATIRLVDRAAFAAMRRGAYLVNVSRGGIVDTPALVEALRRGILAGAALDVVDPEPLPAAHPLWSLPNVLLTPHTAWAGGGAEQLRRIEELIVENVRRYARGEPVLHVASIRHAG
ncbi:MAG: NAD(P)-dependent oxidoreductase [Steroidobacteraceae bacterium]